MASGPTWWECVWWITDAIAAAPTMSQVQVEDSWPGPNGWIKPEILWFAEGTSTESDIPVMSAGPKFYDDRFDLRFEIGVFGRTDRREAQVRLAEIQSEVHRVLAGDASLGDLALSAVITDKSMRAGHGEDGLIAAGHFTVSVHARINPD